MLFCVPINTSEILPGDIGKFIFDTAKGIVSQIPAAIPSPEDFFQITKNVIAGYPFDIAFRIVNAFCE